MAATKIKQEQRKFSVCKLQTKWRMNWYIQTDKNEQRQDENIDIKRGQKLVQVFVATFYILLFLVWFYLLSKACGIKWNLFCIYSRENQCLQEKISPRGRTVSSNLLVFLLRSYHSWLACAQIILMLLSSNFTCFLENMDQGKKTSVWSYRLWQWGGGSLNWEWGIHESGSQLSIYWIVGKNMRGYPA